MKQLKKILVTAMLLACTQFIFAQTPDPADSRLLKFDTAIVIDLAPKFGLQRKAEFKGFFYQLDYQTLDLMWRIRYYQGDSVVTFNDQTYYDKFQRADVTTLVDLTGQIITDTTGHPGPFMREIDFYKFIAQRGTGPQNATINQLIIQAGSKPGRWKD